MRVIFSADAWAQYRSHDRQALKRIDQLIADIGRNGYVGIGKPERLREDLSGWWSRRITDEHRLVYRIVGDDIDIASCKYHYGR